MILYLMSKFVDKSRQKLEAIRAFLEEDNINEVELKVQTSKALNMRSGIPRSGLSLIVSQQQHPLQVQVQVMKVSSSSRYKEGGRNVWDE